MVESGAKNRAMLDVGSLPPEPGDVIAGKYRVESVVGSGGMGVVVAARHLQLGQRVAIKLLRLNGLDPERQVEARARFIREGQAAAALSSDHVVRIHDVGTLDSGEPFMVMELLRGDDLSNLIERQGPAPVGAAVDYILQACHAVAEAHAAGIVHRDLKPSNLFVSIRSDGRASVKVLDFGISKTKGPGLDAFDGNLTDTRSVVGSPYYMSPEQVRDAKRVDVRTDVWSLGMILYELLVGDPAFNGDTLPAICAAIAADTPPPVRASRTDVPEGLDDIVQKCLAKNPDHRFQKVEDLVRALSSYAPPSNVASADYASSRNVLALSEPFSPAARDRETQRRDKTDLSAAPPVAVPETSVIAPVSGKSATKVETPTPNAGSGSRRLGEFATSATLVSSESQAGRAQAARAAPNPGRTRTLVAICLVGAAISFSFLALRSPKSPSPAGAATAAARRPPEPPPPMPAEPTPPAAPAVTASAPPTEATAPSAAPTPPATGAVGPAKPVARPRPAHKTRPPGTTAPDPSDIRLER